jgi:transposase-like protein
MVIMPKAFPLEFRRDVVAVAGKGEAPLSQIAKDFGISESCLHRWLKLADVDDGVRPGVTSSESAELRERPWEASRPARQIPSSPRSLHEAQAAS